MRNRNATTEFDVDRVVDLNCNPDLSPEKQTEARQLLLGVLGPYTEPVLRACGQAMAARRELALLRDELNRIRQGAHLRGIVTGIQNGRARVLLGGTERLLPRPEGVALGIGQTVLTDAEGSTVLHAGEFLLGGQTYEFCELLEPRYALVRSLRESPDDDARQLALVADSVDLSALEPGDRVLGWSLDYGNVVLVTRRLGALRAPVADDAGAGRTIPRQDIVGLDDILEEAELLFLDATSPEYAALLSQAMPALVGLVFQGVPGCGKSMVAEYFIGTVRQRGGRALYRTASHYLSKWVGDGPARMRADFGQLEASFAETGVRPLLIIDELEAIAVDRSQPTALAAGHLDVLDTLLSLLTRTGVRMIGISNVANRFLEAALLRDGRLRLVSFPPTLGRDQVAALVTKCLAGVPLAHEGGSR